MRKITDKVQIAERKQYRRDYANQYYRLRKNADPNYRRQYRSQHHATNINHDHELNKEYYLKNREQGLARNKLTQTARMQRLKTIVLSHYSNNGTPSCVLCNFSDIRALTIDHINGNGNQHRHILGGRAGVSFYYWLLKSQYPDGYRTLCMNCQFTESVHLNPPNRPLIKVIMKHDALLHYGNGKCSCTSCGNTNTGALSLRYIPDSDSALNYTVNRKRVWLYSWLKKNNYPDGYQTLCMNCQFIRKHNKDC